MAGRERLKKKIGREKDFGERDWQGEDIHVSCLMLHRILIVHTFYKLDWYKFCVMSGIYDECCNVLLIKTFMWCDIWGKKKLKAKKFTKIDACVFNTLN